MKIPVPGMKGRMGAGEVLQWAAKKVGMPDKDFGCGCKERAKKLDRAAEFVGWKEWQNS